MVLRLRSTLAKARVVSYDHNSSLIVLATVIRIVNYDRKTFIVQATVYNSFCLPVCPSNRSLLFMSI
jgi:hypothetical protein